MPAAFIARILTEVSSMTDDPPTPGQLSRRMKVPEADGDRFERAIEQLVSDRRIKLGRDGRLRLPEMGNEVVGLFRQTRRGFGFVVPERPTREGDLYIAVHDTGGALSGDRVHAVVTGRRRRGRTQQPTGRIDEVLKRAQTVFAGRLVRKHGRWMIEPDGRSLRCDVLVGDPHARGAGEGAKVVFELTAWPEGDYMAEGVITEVLGACGEPHVETQAVIAASGFSVDFPAEALDEARDAIGRFDGAECEPGQREDLRDTLIFTIDPPEARDFDDAISVDWDEATSRWTLGIHIADVARFVAPGGPLDVEATGRGNSVYLPNHVIPMLPEVLSNGVCSLQEGVDRFTMSAFIQFDERGEVQGQRFCRSMIRSCKRMTYLEAQALIEGDPDEATKHARTATPVTSELLETIRMADRLAKTLRKRRQRDGMIVLDLPEAELFFDDHGRVRDILPEDGAFTHTLIEMFMVEANEAVARHFEDIEIPAMRRIHPEPSFDDLEEVRTMVSGHGVKIPDHPTRKDLQRVLDATRNTPAARSVHFAILRSLTKASYSPLPIGHFALASNQYVHFTSPIRRYPDLTVHRALDAWLDATENGTKPAPERHRTKLRNMLMKDDRVLSEQDLVVLGAQCSMTEERATAAERDLNQFFSLLYVEEHHLGDVLPGVICGFNRGGLFVSLDRYLVEGTVRWGAMDAEGGGRSDRWSEIGGTGRIVAQRSGAVLAIGDPVTVQVVQVSPAGRYMDLMLVNRPERYARKEDRRSRTGRSGKRSGKQSGKRSGKKRRR